MSSVGRCAIRLVLTRVPFRPFKIVSGPGGAPVVEVESGGKAAKYVRVCLTLIISNTYLLPNVVS